MTAYLEARQTAKHFGGSVIAQQDAALMAVIEAWNIMGGQIDWNAIGAVSEMIGFYDTDALIRGLVALRDGTRSA